jgi:hypothetical protein
LVWKIEEKIAKLLITTFTFSSPSYLFYVSSVGKGYILNFLKNCARKSLLRSLRPKFFHGWLAGNLITIFVVDSFS